MKASWECIYFDGKVVCLCKQHYAGVSKHKFEFINRIKEEDERQCDKCEQEAQQQSVSEGG